MYAADKSFNFEKVKNDFSEFSSDALFFIFINKEKSFWLSHLSQISKEFSNCSFIGATTAGQILDEFIYDTKCIITAIKFKTGKFLVKTFTDIDAKSSFKIGQDIAEFGNGTNYKSALIFTEGLNINGSQLVEGINSLNKELIYAGGLAADGPHFKETFIFSNDKFMKDAISIVYFDKNIEFTTSSAGGWCSFGFERKVTKSKDNIIYEIDNKPAINLYKDYFGHNNPLSPSDGLHFPICLSSDQKDHSPETVRTLLAIDESKGSLTFAGDIEEGSRIKLMKYSRVELINAAQELYDSEIKKIKSIEGDAYAFIVSCFGRRLVMGQSTEEEFAITKPNFNIHRGGFYSYGEISYSAEEKRCLLYNQTFTLNLIWEKKS